MVVDHISQSTIKYAFWNDFLWITHQKNTGIAFGMGDSLPNIFRVIFFVILPLLLMFGLAIYIIRGKDLSPLQQWFLAGILGGGIGNLIDRIFRSEGVVDFVSVKFYGLLGMSRFPTFNVADSSIVVFGSLILITHLIGSRGKNEQEV